MNAALLPVLVLAVLVLAACSWGLFGRLRALDRRLRELQAQQEVTLRRLSSEIGALCAGASGMGQHLSRMERQMRRLHERQDQVEMREPMSREYHQAIKLIRKGISLDELMEQCGLARAEAELLMRLHREEPEGRSLREET